MFTAFSSPGPLVVFGGKQYLSEFPSGLAALVLGYQTITLIYIYINFQVKVGKIVSNHNKISFTIQAGLTMKNF
jgi:hypothetical protein